MWKTKKTPWSKLQREIYKLIAPEIKLQIHCAAIRMGSSYGHTDLPRYWITLGKEIIWDYPKDFVGMEGTKNYQTPVYVNGGYPHTTDISAISCLIREYIDTPMMDMFDKVFDEDYWNLTVLLKAADRRIGRSRLRNLPGAADNPAVDKIIAARFALGKSYLEEFSGLAKLPPDFNYKEELTNVLCEKYGITSGEKDAKT